MNWSASVLQLDMRMLGKDLRMSCVKQVQSWRSTR